MQIHRYHPVLGSSPCSSQVSENRFGISPPLPATISVAIFHNALDCAASASDISNVCSSKTYGNINVVIGDSVQCNVHGVLGKGSEADQWLQEVSNRSCWSTVMVDLASNNHTGLVDDRCTLIFLRKVKAMVSFFVGWIGRYHPYRNPWGPDAETLSIKPSSPWVW